jgi:V/A-type H+-transporting ATPase subunit I
MIVTMKKVLVLTLETHREGTLDELRDLGVVHVVTHHDVRDPDVNIREMHNHLGRALALIPPLKDGEALPTSRLVGDASLEPALSTAQDVLHRVERRSQVCEELDRLRLELQRLAPWGDVDPTPFAELAQAGVHVRLIEWPLSRGPLPEFPYVFQVNRDRNILRAVVVSTVQEPAVEGIRFFQLPELSTSAIRERIAELERELDGIRLAIMKHQSSIPLILAAIEQLDRDLELATVRASIRQDRDIAWLTGFVPLDRIDAVREAAAANGWGLVVQDPYPGETVPTLLENPKSVGIIKPVFDLMGTVPGYREFDISLLFLLFFSVFFAMILGDAGYGLILLGASLFSAWKTRRDGQSIGQGTLLMTLLSITTIAWGAITGNWFGYAPFARLPVLESLVVPGIATDSAASAATVQYMCFVLGTVHLSIAHIWKFIRLLGSRPRIAAFAQLGWLSMVLGLFHLVLQLVIDPVLHPMPGYAIPMIAAGLGLVIVFGMQEEGMPFLTGLGRGLAGLIATVLNGIGAFSDIISYIRLFAVGLATLAIAQSFNTMAAGLTESLGGVGGAIAATLVLLLGHTLNLAMGLLSVVVHGVRLNMLEFSGHLGMEWTGVAYAPFRKR